MCICSIGSGRTSRCGRRWLDRGEREDVSIDWRVPAFANEGIDMLLAISGWGWTGIGILGLIIWVLIAFWPAHVARRKGHSWLLFFHL